MESLFSTKFDFMPQAAKNLIISSCYNRHKENVTSQVAQCDISILRILTTENYTVSSITDVGCFFLFFLLLTMIKITAFITATASMI